MPTTKLVGHKINFSYTMLLINLFEFLILFIFHVLAKPLDTISELDFFGNAMNNQTIFDDATAEYVFEKNNETQISQPTENRKFEEITTDSAQFLSHTSNSTMKLKKKIRYVEPEAYENNYENEIVLDGFEIFNSLKNESEKTEVLVDLALHSLLIVSNKMQNFLDILIDTLSEVKTNKNS